MKVKLKTQLNVGEESLKFISRTFYYSKCETKPRISSSQIDIEFQHFSNKTVSHETVGRILRKNSYNGCMPKRKLYVTVLNRKKDLILQNNLFQNLQNFEEMLYIVTRVNSIFGGRMAI